MKLTTKIQILLAIVAIIVLLATKTPIQIFILDFLSKNLPIFSYLREQTSSGTLIGVATYVAFANIPILPSLPSETYGIFAYSKGSNIFGIISVVAGVYIIFTSVYYILGRLLGLKNIEKMTRREVKYSKIFERFAGGILFILYLIPIPIIGSFAPVLILFLGAYRAEFKKVVAIVALATILRFTAFVLLYHYYSPLIEGYLSPLKQFLEIS